MADIDVNTKTAGTPPEVMDAVMVRHFEAEAAHDRAGIPATLTENAEHEPVGFPGAPFHSHDELMGFNEVLFQELEQHDIVPVRRLHGHGARRVVTRVRATPARRPRHQWLARDRAQAGTKGPGHPA